MMLGWEEYVNSRGCLCPLCQREWEEEVRRDVRELLGQLAAMRLQNLSPKEMRQAYIGAITLFVAALELERARTRKPSDPTEGGEEDMELALGWIEKLIRDLADLDRGVVATALRCEVGVEGSMRVNALTSSEWMRRVSGVSLTEGLRLAGRFKTYEEAAQVAADLHGGDVTKEEIINWCHEFKKGRVKHREAAQLYVFQMEALNQIKADGNLDKFLDDAMKHIRKRGEKYRRPLMGRGK
jgi:hypothetical protein